MELLNPRQASCVEALARKKGVTCDHCESPDLGCLARAEWALDGTLTTYLRCPAGHYRPDKTFELTFEQAASCGIKPTMRERPETGIY